MHNRRHAVLIAAAASLLSFLTGTASVIAGGQDDLALKTRRQPFRRLSNDDYNRSIRDLFGPDFAVESYLQKDNVSEGFTNNSALAFSTTDRVRGYLAAAQFVSRTVLGLDDSLVLKQRRWEPQEILEANPNRRFRTALGRFINDFWNRVKEGQRPETPPNLGIRRVRSSSGQDVRALELKERGRFKLRHDFPVGAAYRLTVTGSARKSREPSAVRVSIDGVPVPLWIELAPGPQRSHTLDVVVPRGTRSLLVSAPAGQHVLVSSVEVLGPVPGGPLSDDPATQLAARLSCTEPAAPDRGSALECARQTIRDLATKAFRSGMVSDSDVQALLTPFQAAFDRGMDFRNALSLSIEVLLLHPRFLYRIEFAPPDSTVSRVNDYEFATRLSYFLWGSLPDEELLRIAADRGLVNSPDVVRAQVRRMLDDPRSDALVRSFAFGWLGINALGNHVVDPKTFPSFDEELRQFMLMETQLYLEAFFKENWPIRDLIDSDTHFVNEKLALHYGTENVTGPEFRRLGSVSAHRRGLLTQGAVLTLTSQSNSTSVVKRGLWLLERILCSPVGEVPPNVPALEESAVSGLTLRQQMEKHRASLYCASCHSTIDPAGFSLENYDAIGRWRNMDGDVPIDPSGTLPGPKGPRPFKDFSELRVLLRDDPRVASCVTRKLMTYALGRTLTRSDEAALADILAKTHDDGVRIHDVLTEIALSDPFRDQTP